jgi:hypothetical protein
MGHVMLGPMVDQTRFLVTLVACSYYLVQLIISVISVYSVSVRLINSSDEVVSDFQCLSFFNL